MEERKEELLEAGLSLGREGSLAECVAGLREIVEEFPDFAVAWGHLAYNLLVLDQPAEAAEAYRRLLCLCPDSHEARMRLGDCYRMLGDRSRAHRAYRELRGSGQLKPGELQVRLSETAPLFSRIVRRTPSALRRLAGKAADGAFRGAVFREARRLPSSLPAIRKQGLHSYLTYLGRHYLSGNAYRLPEFPCDLCGGNRFRGLFYLEHRKVVECLGCGLRGVERMPRDGRDVDESVYEGDDSLEQFEELWSRTGFFEKRIERLEEAFRKADAAFPIPGGALFEIGCGHGHLLRHFREQGMKTAGIEASQRFADFCRRKMNLDVHRNTVRGLTGREEAWDVILAYHVLEHLARPSELLIRAHRMLKPGGFLLVETPASDLEKAPLTAKLDDRSGYGNMGHMHFFLPEHVRRYFQRNGFEVVGRYEDLSEGEVSAVGILGRKKGGETEASALPHEASSAQLPGVMT